MAYSIIYVLLNAISALLRQMCGELISPACVLLMGSVCAILFYHAINYNKLGIVYKKCFSEKKLWLNCNLSIALVWICAVYSPPLIGAGLYTFLFFGTLSLCGNISMWMKHQGQTMSHRVSFIALLGLLILMVALNISQHNDKFQFYGIILACLGGIAAFYYSKQSAIMMRSNMTASQLLAVRFYASIIVCLLLLAYKPEFDLSVAKLSFGLVTGVICLIIPVYFLQKGIQKAGPDANAIICSAMPLAAALFQQSYYHDVAVADFIIYFLYSCFAIYPLIRIKKNKVF